MFVPVITSTSYVFLDDCVTHKAMVVDLQLYIFPLQLGGGYYGATTDKCDRCFHTNFVLVLFPIIV